MKLPVNFRLCCELEYFECTCNQMRLELKGENLQGGLNVVVNRNRLRHVHIC